MAPPPFNARDDAGDNSLSVEDYTCDDDVLFLDHAGDNGALQPFTGDNSFPFNHSGAGDVPVDHQTGGFPINQSYDFPINHSGDGGDDVPMGGFLINQSGDHLSYSVDDCMNDPNEVYFSIEDDMWLIPAEPESEVPAAKNPTMNLPPGFKFRPTDEELILHYLKPESIDSAFALKGIITHVNVYDYEPRQLSGMVVNHGDGKMYFYTSVKKMGERKTDRSIKSRPGYYWRPTTTLKPILDNRTGNTLAYKCCLAFHEGQKKTQWLMQEYRLNHTSYGAGRELVLAVIYYRDRKGTEGKQEGN